jgi:hypothetical protein
MGDNGNTYRVLMGKSSRKEAHQHRFEDNIKVKFKNENGIT